jgi:hypothetical protein
MFVQPGKTLSVRKWQAAFTTEGFLDIGKTLSRIQRGVSLYTLFPKTATLTKSVLNIQKITYSLNPFACFCYHFNQELHG